MRYVYDCPCFLTLVIISNVVLKLRVLPVLLLLLLVKCYLRDIITVTVYRTVTARLPVAVANAGW